MEIKEAEQIRERPLNIIQELALYKISIKPTQEQSFEDFWVQYSSSLPLLTALVLEYCIMCTASLFSESSFSQANVIQTKQRHSLSGEALHMSVFMKDKINLMGKIMPKQPEIIN